MIILGHDFIESRPFYLIKSIEDISKTPSNSTVIFDFNEQNIELCKHCVKNGISFALITDRIKDILFANAIRANFIVCDKTLSSKAQKFADEYMFDAKILLYGTEDADLEWAADIGIDGILFEKGIDYGSY